MISNRSNRALLTLVPLIGSVVGVSIFGFPARLSANVVDNAWPVLLRRDLSRSGRTEWRLRSAAGSACPRQVSDIGIVLDDRRAYRKQDWPLLKASLNMGHNPVIAGIAPGGPADLGGLQEGDELLSIGGKLSEAIIAKRDPDILVVDSLLDELDHAAPGVPLSIDLHRDGKLVQLHVVPVLHCAVRLVLLTDRQIKAHSDTRNVAISTGMLAFARSDDELALAAGHEVAHIINGDRRGAPTKVRRAMEDAADALGLHLMECAGYDRAAGILLFDRLGSRDWLGFLRAGTHRSWKARTMSLHALPTKPSCPVSKKQG